MNACFSTLHTRLSKLGVCVSFCTVLRAVEKMGENHDLSVCQWKDSLSTAAGSIATASTEIQPVRGYVIVGDNIDKRVNPREMRVDRQVQSLHYFHTYAVKNRCDSTHSDDLKPMGRSCSYQCQRSFQHLTNVWLSETTMSSLRHV